MNKEKKIYKLKKARVWPSVLFLIFSIFISLLAFGGFIISTMTILCEERFNSACTNAISISRMFENSGKSEADIIENICGNSDFTDCIFVFDKNGNTIASHGAPTYIELDSENVFTDEYTGTHCRIYSDTSVADNLIAADGYLNTDMIVDKKNVKYIMKHIKDSSYPMFEAKFWLENRLSDGRKALIQCSATLWSYDFNRAFFMGAGAVFLMGLPVLFFFVNVILSVRNQVRSTKLLYLDTVTAGNNMLYFEHEAEKELFARKNRNRILAIADITIVKYRNYCNYHGARAGEILLEKIDRQLSGIMQKGEFSAHTAKSSFAVFIPCMSREEGLKRISFITDELSQVIPDGGICFHAGVYFSEPSDRKFGSADCLNCAGAARALITDNNDNGISVYNDNMLEEQIWEHKVEEKMKKALENKEFKVYIQPKYNPVTEKIAGGEALVRWINEEDGFISPGKFIPIFENNGFITKLDDYMISEVARLQAQWLKEGKNIVPVSVNVSRAHFSDPNLAQHICGLVDKYNVPHKYIEIELTESAFFDDKASLLKTVHELSSLDFEISMDDFGAGYSSLNSLKDLPLDVLKLDAEFFRGDSSEERGEIVVSQAINLAKQLNMRIVAEGVEKKEQVDFLAKQGCDMIQGFYFAKPMPAEEYAEKELAVGV